MATGYYIGSHAYKLIVHRLETIFIINDHNDIEQIVKQFNINETKEKSGEKYKVKVYRESKGESIAVYEYIDKTVVRVNTHRLNKRQYVLDYINHFNLQVVRDYAELYARIDPKYEFQLNTALISYCEVKGLGYYTQSVMREWKRLIYITRSDKHTIGQGLTAVIKLYRDKDIKEDPKIEIEFFAKRQLTSEDFTISSKIISTLLKLTKSKQVFNEYDKNQDYIVVDIYDKGLHRALYSTSKRIALSFLLNKDIKDKRIAIANLLDRGMRPIDLSRLTGYTKQRIYQIIDELIEKGIIERAGHGKYKLKIKTSKEVIEHPVRAYKIVNMEVDNIIIEYIHDRRIARDRNHTIYYIKKKYPNAIEHPESVKYRFHPPIFYINDNGNYHYILVKAPLY